MVAWSPVVTKELYGEKFFIRRTGAGFVGTDNHSATYSTERTTFTPDYFLINSILMPL